MSQNRRPVTKEEIDIRAYTGGSDYRVLLRGCHQYRFVLSGEHVMIYTSSSNLGGFSLQRFGGVLSPKGIRKFLIENVRI